MGQSLERSLKDSNFDQVLADLSGNALGEMSPAEKEDIIVTFDQFLEEIALEDKTISRHDINQLSEIKKVLILMELDKDGYNRERCKSLLQEHVCGYKPLADLVKKPFTIEIGPPEAIELLPSDNALELYGAALREIDVKKAGHIHQKQLAFYYRLGKEERMKQYSLRNLRSAYSLES